PILKDKDDCGFIFRVCVCVCREMNFRIALPNQELAPENSFPWSETLLMDSKTIEAMSGNLTELVFEALARPRRCWPGFVSYFQGRRVCVRKPCRSRRIPLR